MLDEYVVDRIRALLDEGKWSHRKIAHHLNVGRATIGDIAKGRRGVHGRAVADSATPQVVRCPACGARVYMPCVACRAREYRCRTNRQDYAGARLLGTSKHQAGESKAA